MRVSREETGTARCGGADAVKTVGRVLPEPGDRGPSVPADGAATPAPPSPRPRPRPAAADTDAGGPLDPPPWSWVQAVRALVEEHADDDVVLAPLLDEPEQAIRVDGVLELHPWWRRRDVDALLSWARHLDGPVTVWRGPGRGRTWETLWVEGYLAGTPTRLVAHSHRLPTDPSVRLTLPLLQAIGRQETGAPAPAPELAAPPRPEPVRLSPWFEPAARPLVPAGGG